MGSFVIGSTFSTDFCELEVIFKVCPLCVCRMCLVPNWQHCFQRLWWRPLRLRWRTKLTVNPSTPNLTPIRWSLSSHATLPVSAPSSGPPLDLRPDTRDVWVKVTLLISVNMLLLCLRFMVSSTWCIKWFVFGVGSCDPPHSSRFTPCPRWSFPSPPSCCCPHEAASPAYVLHRE